MSGAPDWFRQDVLQYADEFAETGDDMRCSFLAELKKTTDWIAEHPRAGSSTYESLARIRGLRHKAFHLGSMQFYVFYVVAPDGTATMRRLVPAVSDFASKLAVLGE